MSGKLTTKSKVQNKTVEMTLMDHVIAGIDIDSIVQKNKKQIEKIIGQKIQEIVVDFDWYELLSDAMYSDRIRTALNARMNTALEQTFLSAGR
jgi:hypothetical protein